MSESLELKYINTILDDEEKQMLEWINDDLDFKEILSAIKKVKPKNTKKK